MFASSPDSLPCAAPPSAESTRVASLDRTSCAAWCDAFSPLRKEKRKLSDSATNTAASTPIDPRRHRRGEENAGVANVLGSTEPTQRRGPRPPVDPLGPVVGQPGPVDQTR